jgi:hypothetical protein
VFTSRPRNLLRFDRILAWWESRCTRHSRSPNGGAFCRSHDVGEQDGREQTIVVRLVVADLLQEVLDLEKQSLRITEEEEWSRPGSSTNLAPEMPPAVLCTSSIGKRGLRSPDRERRHVEVPPTTPRRGSSSRGL